jgi:site-specific DNA recombinase
MTVILSIPFWFRGRKRSLFRLTLLAPNIVGAILNGNQPPELTARKLMDDTRLPLDWNEQRRALGFA